MEITFDLASSWSFDRDSVAFPALVDGKLVRCFVSQEALQDHFDGGILGADLVATFEANRGVIEGVARRKLETTRDSPLILRSQDF